MSELIAGRKFPRESGRAVVACNDYLRLGAGRSLRRLLDKYNAGDPDAAPVRSLDTLNRWSGRFNWQERAAEYDAYIERMKTEEHERVMRSGFALEAVRVQKLSEIINRLDVLMSVENENGVPVHLLDSRGNFRPALMAELRATLADIAAETGGRIRKNEVTGSNAAPVEMRFRFVNSFNDMLDDEDENGA